MSIKVIEVSASIEEPEVHACKENKQLASFMATRGGGVVSPLPIVVSINGAVIEGCDLFLLPDEAEGALLIRIDAGAMPANLTTQDDLAGWLLFTLPGLSGEEWVATKLGLEPDKTEQDWKFLLRMAYALAKAEGLI